MPHDAFTARTPGSAERVAAVRVVVVDDHAGFRKSLIDALKDEPGIVVCGEAGTVRTGLDTIAAHEPDVAIVDLSLGQDSGFDLVSTVATTHPGVRVLVLSAYDDREVAEAALKAGALGYLAKVKVGHQLLAAVRRVAAGNTYVSPEAG